jgi:probable rRNA maturation factor
MAGVRTMQRGGVTVEIVDRTRTPLGHAAIADLVVHVLEEEGAVPAELGLRFVGERTMRGLNAAHRGVRGVTDVLSFPLEEPGEWPAGAAGERPPRLLGDVVVCPRQAARQAAGDDTPVAHELAVLLVHGVLHLLGWEHDETPGPMGARQAELLRSFEWSRLVRA